MFTDEDFPADPYPGVRPDRSFLHRDGRGYELPDPLAVDGRIPVLAYGSNACPSKITWLRENLGLRGDVIVLRARCTGIAAVWASGVRLRDGQRTATLAAMPGVVETHAVWLATPEQLAVLDVCEGRGKRYHLARLGTSRPAGPTVTVDGLKYVSESVFPPEVTTGTRAGGLRFGEVGRRPRKAWITRESRPGYPNPIACTLKHWMGLPEVFAYVGASPARMPLLVNGRPVRVEELPHPGAQALKGVPASSHGLNVSVIQR
ncbi:gamma-glutamylcyclotransferase [Amycolatopsis taiwanensis]|uniref:Gamma-glutamylcyclotransferase n=1 Tax=Amycolatopsis taiwanensis TaxID=342230 RepID=A0A9W6R4A0_9PSEU|nr:gamma-glutamylcyclotransferase [Amycolatopsis taiwanensis]